MESLVDKLRDYFVDCQGRIVNLRDLRITFKIEPGSSDDDLLRAHLSRTLVKEKIVVPLGRKDGEYKVIKQVKPVRVFAPDRVRRPIFDFRWPQDREKGMEIEIGEKIIVREGDLITLGGVKSKGKTTVCLNIAAENIEKSPILMGNEYTRFIEGDYVPDPRFLNRLDLMSKWVEWTNGDGYDRFTLLPVKEDYAEHIVPDKINIIDWINIDAGQLYDIGKVLEGIKSAIGKGILIVALQKGEGAVNPRGGQFVRDFSDVEILLDGYGKYDDDILMTIKGCKEKSSPIVNKTYAYTIANEGTEITDFREVVQCSSCKGSGYSHGSVCENCLGKKYSDK